MEKFFKPLNWVADRLEGQYTGRFRGLAQAMFLSGLLIVATSPFLIYVTLLSLQLPSPYCYIGFSAWIGFMFFILLCEVYVLYVQAKRMIASFSKEFNWDLEKYSAEYFEIIEKQRAKSREKKKRLKMIR